MWESRGGSTVNGAPRQVSKSAQCTPLLQKLRDLSCLLRPTFSDGQQVQLFLTVSRFSIDSLEQIEGPPRDFLKASPRQDQTPKTLGATGPKGFWPLVWPKNRVIQTNQCFFLVCLFWQRFETSKSMVRNPIFLIFLFLD